MCKALNAHNVEFASNAALAASLAHNGMTRVMDAFASHWRRLAYCCRLDGTAPQLEDFAELVRLAEDMPKLESGMHDLGRVGFDGLFYYALFRARGGLGRHNFTQSMDRVSTWNDSAYAWWNSHSLQRQCIDAIVATAPPPRDMARTFGWATDIVGLFESFGKGSTMSEASYSRGERVRQEVSIPFFFFGWLLSSQSPF